MPETNIDSDTLRAFLETEYKVHGEYPFTLRIGAASLALVAAHKHHGVDCSAFISACNPFSRIVDDDTNSERHAELGRVISRLGFASIEGVGQHPLNQWPGETSLLVFGLSLEAAKSIGTQMKQNAIVWSGADAIPQLILLR